MFWLPFNSDKYMSVLNACALHEDLDVRYKVLPQGDLTEVGESGVTLSGGQKARISLARAVYQDKSVYLLDDPLSAVDAHVANHLFNQCIVGILKNKTRVLCTHHVQMLQEADGIIVLEDGQITKFGKPDKVLKDLDVILHTSNQKSVTKEDESPHDHELTNEEEEVGAALIQEEEKDTGEVKLHVYRSYWRAVGSCLAFSVLLSLLLMQGSRNINDWWLSYWVTHSHRVNVSQSHVNVSQSHINVSSPYTAHSDVSVFAARHIHLYSQRTVSPIYTLYEAEDNINYYLTVYGILAGTNSLLTLIRAFLFAYAGLCAARRIHVQLLASILKAPVAFYDVTPLGRIINRFSSDLYTVDDSLPFIMNILLAQLYGVAGTIAVTCYGLPWFALLLLPLGIMYYFIQKYYRKTSREIKRIASVTLSPVYAHFSETISGLVTIRAFRHSTRFRDINRTHLEKNIVAQFSSMVAGQWLNIRLQMFGVAMVTGVAFIAVLEHHFQSVNPGLVGLALSYALSVTDQLSAVVFSFTETEKQMVSVERASQYINDIPEEKARGIMLTPYGWPLDGVITFKDVCLQYRQGLALALNKVSFKTHPSEKLGIVGRTGSGKSSLFLALFRIVETTGTIYSDGVNINTIDLVDLRSRIAIIPQDPFLFSASVKENLDPTGQYQDVDLWTVLDKCHLKMHVTNMGGLEEDVGERGCNLSAGQKQLICLARALLTNAKILCIDEATARVDMQTDNILQETIHEAFQSKTVITIAHRINTILNSDRVMVMEQGNVAEIGPPKELLKDSNTLFYSLVYGFEGNV